jgi:ABC-type multidrug transport system fused ATPase/permease subunit
VPAQRGLSGEYRAGLVSSLYFQWMAPLLSGGYQRRLELNDIWEVNPERSLDKLWETFKACLNKRKETPERLDPLIMAIYDTFKADFLIGGAAQLIAGLIQVLSPFVLKYLIQYVEEAYEAKFHHAKPPSIGRGVGLVIGIAAMQLLQSLCTNQYYYRGMILGVQARSTIIACITEKAMKLSGRARIASDSHNNPGWSNAKIGNLMSTDTSRIDSAAVTIHRCWVSPIQVVLALVLLCINLSYSALVGFGLFCGAMPLLAMAIGALMARRDVINKLTDERIHLTQETFSAIRTVKYFTWESKLLSRL